jgi:hypothetical protein
MLRNAVIYPLVGGFVDGDRGCLEKGWLDFIADNDWQNSSYSKYSRSQPVLM